MTSASRHETYAYDIVDVFTKRSLEGNALAVVHDADGLGTVLMQKIAREFNLSETTFVLPPILAANAAHVRIFTPTMEMPFAGHPTIGTSFVLRERGLVSRDVTRFVLEEGIGAVPVRVERGEPDTLWLTTPPISWGETFDHATCARALGIASDDLLPPQPQLVTAGNPTIFIAVRDAETVDRAWLDRAGLHTILGERGGAPCVFVFAPTETGAYSRMFGPEHGVVEDPATGSSTGPLAAYMMEHRLVRRADGTRFTSIQGAKMGRRSELHVLVSGQDGLHGIEVGEAACTSRRGSCRFDRAPISPKRGGKSERVTDETLVGCLMRFEDPPHAALSPLCKELRERVAFRWTLESAGTTVATGEYGTGDFSPVLNVDSAVGRFSSQKQMPSGNYTLAIAELVVPHQLAAVRPRLHVVKRVDEYDISPFLLIVGGVVWSLGFLVAALVAFLVSRGGPATH